MLNGKQLEAIKNIYEPTLVIAGPGTGKTELLSERIGQILKQTDAKPESILCLTYSRAGVKAMRDRLGQKINKDVSEKVQIHTFHSFCESVINAKRDYFNKKGKSIIDDIKLFDLLFPLVTNPEFSGILNTVKPPTSKLLNNIKKIFNTIKEEKLQIVQLKTNTLFKIGQLLQEKQTKKVAEHTEKLQKFHDCLLLIEHLIQQIANAGLYDFNDMIDWVIKFFNNHPDELQSYRENLLFVLVDEFQDTNPLQLTLLNQLILKNGDDEPAFFAVGDDDQCIYRFQGANIETIIQINHDVPNIRRIVLDENYRSTQDILDMAGNLIAHNEVRVVNKIEGLTKKLVVGKDGNKGFRTIPTIFHCIDKIHESEVILHDIKDKINNHDAVPSDFAILYRNRSHGEQIIDLVKKSGLPYNSKDDQSNILNMGFVPDIINALLLIRMEYYKGGTGDGFLFNIILNNKAKYNVLDCLELKKYLESMGAPKNSFIQNLSSINRSEVHPTLFEKLKSITYRLLNFTLRMNEEMAQQDWEELYSILEVDQSDEILAADWKRFIENEIIFRKNFTLLQWIEVFMDYDFYGVSIKSSKEITKYGITLSTVHGSKGLEFKHVYIIGCSDNKWEQIDVDNSSIKFPNFLSVDDNNIEDKRRLFYVGLTRAEKSITFSYYQDGRGKSRKYELSRFVKEAIPNYLNNIQNISNQLSNSKPKIDVKVILGNHYQSASTFIRDSFRFSPSSFKNFNECSSKFLLQNIFNMPSTSAQIPSFGTAVHAMIENIISNNMHQIDLHDGVSYIQKKWPEIIGQCKHFFTRKNLVQYEKFGLEIITYYYTHYLHQKVTGIPVLQEQKCEGVLGEAKIKGVLDRIEFLNNEALIFDYKTGNKDYTKWKIFKNEENPGGDHWKQAMFYAALATQNHPESNLQSITFHYVEEKEPKNVIQSIPLDPYLSEWVQYVNDKWVELQNFSFYNPCNDSQCLCCRHLN